MGPDHRLYLQPGMFGDARLSICSAIEVIDALDEACRDFNLPNTIRID